MRTAYSTVFAFVKNVKRFSQFFAAHPRKSGKRTEGRQSETLQRTQAERSALHAVDEAAEVELGYGQSAHVGQKASV